MPAAASTWAISPPMVPAPTTAALKTNMAAEASGARRATTRPVWRCAGTEGASFASVLLRGVVARYRWDARRGIGTDRRIARMGWYPCGALLIGVADDEIRWRVAEGRADPRAPRRLPRRPPAPSIEADLPGCCPAGGEGALLGGRAAAHLFALTKGEAPPAEVITRTQRRIEGVTSHRSRTLDARDATTLRGIPVTTGRARWLTSGELVAGCARRAATGRGPLRHHAESGRGSARATGRPARA